MTTELVTFKGGFVASLAVVSRLLDLEARGAQFLLLPNGGFRVVPGNVLTDEDRAFLVTHRSEARAVVRYQADDGHLFGDGRARQPPSLPPSGDVEVA